jgi:hypothetical protein
MKYGSRVVAAVAEPEVAEVKVGIIQTTAAATAVTVARLLVEAVAAYIPLQILMSKQVAVAILGKMAVDSLLSEVARAGTLIQSTVTLH